MISAWWLLLLVPLAVYGAACLYALFEGAP